MAVDLTYRLVLLALLAAGFAAAAILVGRVERREGAVPRSADGPVMSVAIAVAGISFYGGLLLYIVYPPLLGWAATNVPPAWRWAGAALFAAGASLAVWARHTLGESSTVTAVPRDDAELVTRGPYRRVRHPIYAAGLLIIPGATLLTANLFVLGAGAAVMAVLMIRTRREEALLLEKHGDAYRDYMARTGRLLPRLRAPREPGAGAGRPGPQR